MVRPQEPDRNALVVVLEEAQQALNVAVRILPRAWLTGSSVSFEEWEAGWQQVDTTLAHIAAILNR